MKPRFILTKHLINPVKNQSFKTKLTPLDLLIGLPVNGFKAPCGPSPSFCASYFNRIFSYISLSLFLSLSKCLLVTKDREDIARVEALARKAIPATIFYEMQNMRVGRFFWAGPCGYPRVLATRFLKLLTVPYSKTFTTRPGSE